MCNETSSKRYTCSRTGGNSLHRENCDAKLIVLFFMASNGVGVFGSVILINIFLNIFSSMRDFCITIISRIFV